MTAIRVEALPQEVAKRIREMIRKGTLKKGTRSSKNLCVEPWESAGRLLERHCGS